VIEIADDVINQNTVQIQSVIEKIMEDAPDLPLQGIVELICKVLLVLNDQSGEQNKSIQDIYKRINS
jgi:hypothetical protein